MSTKGKPNRIELHRLKFKKEKGVALLSLSEMSRSEISFITKKVFSHIEEKKCDFYTAYHEVFADWGIMCSHPQEKRLYLGWLQLSVHNSQNKWFRCSCCCSHGAQC